MHEHNGIRVPEEAGAGGECAKRAFGEFWRAYYRRMLNFSRTFPGIPESDREDAVADLLIGAFGAMRSYDPSRSLSAWLYGVARHKFLDAQRIHTRFARTLIPFNDDGSVVGHLSFDLPVAHDHAVEAEVSDLVERCGQAIDRLPERDRRIAILRFYEDMDSKDIGQALGMPAASVRWRIAEIRKRIAASVEGLR